MPAVKIGKPVVQYEETDWEFCRRMAGSMGVGIFSHADGTHPHLTAGLAEGRAAEFLYYEVSTGQHYRIGDHARYKGRKLYIYEAKAALERGNWYLLTD